ncbi:beta strand repeat-containing protein [Nocardioides montaniterrae]
MAVPRAARRLLVATSLAIATTGSALAAAGPAHAATTWTVATTGANTAACGPAATPCSTVTYALAKAAAGDTINVAAGSYADRPLIGKAISIVGLDGGATFTGSASTTAGWALGVNAAGAVNLTNLTLTGGHYQAGGALPIVNGTVTTTNVNVTNSAAINGGGVYVANGSLTMNQGSVTGNTATATAANQGWGGGILGAAAATLKIDGTLVADNKSDGAGKALGLGGGLLTLGPTTVTNATFRNNTAGPVANAGYGGGVYVAGPSFTATGSTFTGNSAFIGGGFATAKPATLQGDTVSSNTAALGGGVYSTANLAVTGGELSNDKATTNYGGALYVSGTPTAPTTASADGTTFNGNSAPTSGGAIYTTGNTTTSLLGGASLSNNTAQSGAAVANAGSLTVRNSSISGNNASYQGGALYNGPAVAADNPTATLVDSSLDNNTAAFAGGALSNAAPGTLTVRGGHLNGNSAVAGGALVNASSASVTSVVASQNVATQLGGGAFYNGATLDVADSALSGNTATWTSGNTTGLGGAVYSGSGTANATTKVSVRRTTIDGNHGYAGSAISAWSSGSGTVNQLAISDSTIAGNVASSTSGAILAVGSKVSVARSTLSENTAATNGFSVLAMSNATVGVAGSIIAGNGGSACNLAVTNGGSNLVGSGATTCALGSAQDPQLGALGANGGIGATYLPGPASPALDRITAGATATTNDAVSDTPIALCDATDERGTARPQGAKCDIGAVEAKQHAPTVDGPAHLDVTVGSATDASTYTATGSPLPTLTATGLPAGLRLVDNGDGTAALSGAPTGPGAEVHATITATNEAGATDYPVTVVVHQAPTLSGPSSDTFTVGHAGGADVFTQTGGFPIATQTVDGTLPGGVTFTDGGSGTSTIAGTPATGTGGVYPLTVRGSNGTGPDAAWPFRLTVDEAPSVTGPGSATYTVGTAASTDLTVGGYPAPTLSATGLPAGVDLHGSGISGKPAAGSGGEYDATVTATNGIGADATHAVHVTVDEAPSLAGPQAVRMVAGQSTSFAYAAVGYPVPTITRTGALPAGVTLVDNGNGTATLSGKPTNDAVGSYTLTLHATNGIGSDASYAVTVDVVPPVSIATTSLPNGQVGQAYDAQVSAAGGLAPYVFSVSAGSLPDGLSLGADGHVTGKPTADSGTYTFTVKVADGTGQTATKQLSIMLTKGTTALYGPPVILSNGLNLGTLSATLTGGIPPQAIAGQTVTFKAGSTVLCSGVTNTQGVASCNPGVISTVLQPILNQNLVAVFAGSAKWMPATAQMGLIG